MGVEFLRSIGAGADVKELEYIAALHQTCFPDRPNGSISSRDVQALLTSRYGLMLSHKECIEIVRSLGGGLSQEELQVQEKAYSAGQKMIQKVVHMSQVTTSSLMRKPSDSVQNRLEESQKHIDEELCSPEEYLDLVQITALLLIPVLARAAKIAKENDYNTTIKEDNDEEKKDEEPTNWYQKWRQTRRAKKEALQAELAESLLPQPHTILQDVFRIMMKDVAFSDQEEGPLLDVDLVEAILLECGEFERAGDDALKREMVEVATSGSGRLDFEAFVNALAYDLDAWEVGSEDRLSTIFFDVFGEERSIVNERCRKERRNDPVADTEIPKEGVFTSANSVDHAIVDLVVDTHSSVICVCLIWFFYLMTSVTYASIYQSRVTASCLETEKKEEFTCLLKAQLWNWFMVAIFLGAFGIVTIVPLSLGNNPNSQGPKQHAIALFVTLLYSVPPYFGVQRYRADTEEPYDDAEQRVNQAYFIFYLYITLGAGVVLATYYLICLFAHLFKGIGQSLFIPSNTVGEFRIKKAATRKVNTMLMNACVLHDSSEPMKQSLSDSRSTLRNGSSSDETMLNFVFRGNGSERAGGFLWTWELFQTGALFEKEGIWLPTRMIVFQTAQVGFTIILSLILFSITGIASILAGEAQESLTEELPSWARQLVPTRRGVELALYPASIAATFTMVLLVVLYIPSSTATLLQYRCGLIPSLGSRYFTKYRRSADTACMNIGNAVYGLIGAGTLVFLIVGLFAFLFIWDFSNAFMIKVLAFAIGLTITISMKMLLTNTCRQNFYKAFYRTKPRTSNITTLALETWFIGLGSGVLIGRISQFLFAAVFWVGRIDVPFLSEDVSLYGYAFDYVPTNFIKDLLVHEAHRHPFIERLSQMYLMKFRHQSKFVNDAGAVWRQVFVQYLMPWLRKYRIMRAARMSQSIEALALQKIHDKEEAKGVVERFGDDVHNLKTTGEGVAIGLVGLAGAATGMVDEAAGTTVDILEATAGLVSPPAAVAGYFSKEDAAKQSALDDPNFPNNVSSS
ncbi:hypothetical protein FisN_19Hh192 [Fistulifera solaris]|uniref:Uncharacterized protein n=1 Tax=Fistulifera solaris TaxID=1519565 RepID=A0A1Z5K0G3_FISSO|nr:hypothetical protein FisN_19Hh192 [Fistulifera solaris]|eukprot:GAX19612.1 hypothetical protein FisN_19Hh192 [Fistulifera solaris]